MATNQERYNRKQHEAAWPRARIAIAMRKAGNTWEQIGAYLGISRQRARALAKAHSNEKHTRKPTKIV